MPDGQGRVPHPPGGVDQLVKQAHLHCSPASVRACHQSHTSHRGSEKSCGMGTSHRTDMFIQCVKLRDSKTNAPTIKLTATENILFTYPEKEL